MTTEKFDSNPWVEISEEQAEKIAGGYYEPTEEIVGYTNPAGKPFDELPGKGHIKGKGKKNWGTIVEITEPSGSY